MTDYFTKEEVYDILDSSQTKIGVDIVTYKFSKLRDAKNLTTSNTYAVRIKHRIQVKGSSWKSGGDYQSNGFNNYPIMLSVQSGIISTSDKASKINLKRVFPKTINASVEQSSNQSTGSSNSQTNQSTSGSSTSNVNTFGVNVSAGFFGDLPVGSFGMDYSHSWGDTSSQSTSVGHDKTSNLQATSGDEMSVKDWSAYSSISNYDGSSHDFIGEVVQWDWGQTYPWNIFKYSETGSGSSIVLPEDVIARLLYYGSTDDESPIKNILLPPSDLSLFGLDFSMVAEWQIVFPENLTSIETLSFQHQVNVIQGSHAMLTNGNNKANLSATLTNASSTLMKQTTPVDLGKYALAPLKQSHRNGGGIGFKDHLFDIAPSQTNPFKILSGDNNLLISGTGFDDVMSASFKQGYSGEGATLNVSFKVTDVSSEYALILHHWKGAGSGDIKLTCSINNHKKWNTVINVGDAEGEGASNNIDQLDLRNFNLKSANFHDYLVLGYNEIEITILPSDTSAPSEYVISALAIEA